MLQRYTAKEDTDAYIAEVQPEFPFKDLQALVDDNKNGENMGEEAYKRFVKALATGVSKSSPEYIAKIAEKRIPARYGRRHYGRTTNLTASFIRCKASLSSQGGRPARPSCAQRIIAAITGLPPSRCRGLFRASADGAAGGARRT
jgi:hypothetical protein